MPVLSNARHERFAQELAAGKSASAAYEAAGYKPSRQNAGALKQNQDISLRVAELLQEREAIHGQAIADAVKETAITKAWVIERLVQNVERAMQVEEIMRGDEGTGEFQYAGSVANRALELLGKELGMFIDRREIGLPGEFDAMDDDQLAAYAQEQAAELIRKGPRETSH